MKQEKKTRKNNLGQAHPIRLIVGLSNPGDAYAKTRHNAGAWLIEALAKRFQTQLRAESKFQGLLGNFQIGEITGRLLLPTRYMNQNGFSVGAVARFYHISPSAILVAHDELDFPAGVTRLKQGGGHGGHNGLRSVIQHLKSNDFLRVRIGIGHPGDRNKVHDYVLNRPSQNDQLKIMESIDRVSDLMEEIIVGNIQDAMKQLHTDT